MKIKAVHFLLLLGVLLTTQVEARFPEFGFCPLGGPPGWFNRLSGQSYRYYPPPQPYPVQSPDIPYRAYAYPVPQFRPAFFEQKPVNGDNR